MPHALLNQSVKRVTISGKAGTGKTLLALAAALETRMHHRQILLTRPIVPLSNKDIGFLHGDIQSKIKPYMQPLFDNLISNSRLKVGRLFIGSVQFKKKR